MISVFLLSSIIQICTNINDTSGKSIFVLMFSGLKVKVMSLKHKTVNRVCMID
jgi:hypothetical protein